jgi:hypothetical protein
MDPQRFPTTFCPRTLVSYRYTNLGLKAHERGTAKQQNRTTECRLQILQTAPLSTARYGCSIGPSCRTGNVLGLGDRRLLNTRFSPCEPRGVSRVRSTDVSTPRRPMDGARTGTLCKSCMAPVDSTRHQVSPKLLRAARACSDCNCQSPTT